MFFWGKVYAMIKLCVNYEMSPTFRRVMINYLSHECGNDPWWYSECTYYRIIVCGTNERKEQKLDLKKHDEMGEYVIDFSHVCISS